MNTLAQPQREAILAAEKALRPMVLETPLVPLRDHNNRFYEPAIWLKPEILQPVTSFKLRGILHAVQSMTEEERQRGISTVSAGNTAQALAWAGRHFGVTARTLMPDGAPVSKVEAVHALGGETVLVPTAEVFNFLKGRGWEDEPYAFVHPWIDPRVITGHASLGLEIGKQLGNRKATLYASVGGGGLLAGSASGLAISQADTEVVAVEPDGCAAFLAARRHGGPVDIECDTICDGVAVPYMTDEMFPLLDRLTDRILTVADQTTIEAMRVLLHRHKMLVEASGAITVAAALSDQQRIDEQRAAVCILSGGSVSASMFQKLGGAP